MTDILYLFPDTNLFIQCRSLEQLDWSCWQSFDEVHLIVSRPVHKEVDYQKNKGNDRVGRRARMANSLFREITLSGQERVIRQAHPRVSLLIKVEYAPSPALEGRLDYSERDDQLIGTIATFTEQHSGADVRLLTDDGTPMATAKSLGIAVAPIPTSWLLPPETTDLEKKANALEAELARLRKTEPQFRVSCVNPDGEALERLTCTFERFEALTEAQLSVLVNRLKERFPIATDFGPREPAERTAPGVGLLMSVVGIELKETYVPVSEKDIALYRDNQYPEWLQSCRTLLSQYASGLNELTGPPTFSFHAENYGTRPGKDVLITFKVRGNFLIKPPPYRDETQAGEQAPPVALPRPPAPPRGRWEPKSRVFNSSMLKEFQRVSGPIGFVRNDLIVPPLPSDYRRDPNEFYYKPGRASVPASMFSLECEQWRHGADQWTDFRGEIHFAESEQQVEGMLECLIHAENLSDPVSLRVPVRIGVLRVSAFERAQRLVEELTA